MALRLNLYHEIERQKQAERRDPLKLSMLGLAVIAVLFALYYVWQLGSVGILSRELSRKKAEFAALEPKAKAAQQREEELSKTLKASELLVKRIEGRLYWAPILEQLTTLVPREAQVTRFSGEVQGDDVKKCTLTVEGVAAGADPRKVAEDLRTAIAEEFSKKYRNVTSIFRSLEDGAESARLDGKTWPTATFSINVQLAAGDDTGTAPVAARRTPKKP
jgi:Tfp pilus assembly protein PilN